MAAVGDARKRAVESAAAESSDDRPWDHSGCDHPGGICSDDPGVTPHRGQVVTASERAAGELVADIDTLAAAIRNYADLDPRGLAEALVGVGFGRVDAARREIEQAERRGARAVVVAVEAVAAEYEIPRELRGRANNLCRADAAQDFRAAARDAARNARTS